MTRFPDRRFPDYQFPDFPMHDRFVQRRIAAALLILDGLGTAVRLMSLLPTLVVYGPVTLTLLAARALVALLQFTSGWMLWDDRPPARPIAIAALIASALLMIPEVGMRLAPSNLDPTFRWWAVGAYAIYAAAIGMWIRRTGHRSGG